MKRHNPIRLIATCTLILLGVFSTSSSSFAQSSSVAVNSGGLGFAVAPTNFSFPTVALNGSPQTVTTSQSWDVADDTGSYNGWNVQVTTPTLTTSLAATTVYGQGGSFTTGTANNGGITADSLNNPQNIIVDSGGNTYISDTTNNRVLYYPSGSTTATRVYGQLGSFTVAGANNGGRSANSLNGPGGLALDGGGNLYVTDINNNRVLYYPSGSTTATRVYGQLGSFAAGAANNGGISANTLVGPEAVTVDTSGNLYIADTFNNRVLYYTAGSTTATRVYGQLGSYLTNTNNTGGLSADSLLRPYGVTADTIGNLYITDTANNRVLYYTAGSTTATRVYGQLGSFTTNTANNGGITSTSLAAPSRTALDTSSNLYIPDLTNNRILFYPAGSTTAIYAYGQGGSLATGTANNGGLSASSLQTAFGGISLSPGGKLYTTDSSNNRALAYNLVHTLPQPSVIAYTPTQTCDIVGNCIAAVNPGTITYPLVLPTTATKILNAAANSGVGHGTFNSQVYSLTVPPTAAIGVYTSTYDIAITSGP